MKKQRQQQLETRIQSWRALPAGARLAPTGGWVRSIRESLGMTGVEFAHRLGLSSAAVTKLELSEQNGTVGLNTLTRAAAALECDVVYALVPRQPIDEIVQDQALAQAQRAYQRIETTMALEAQKLTPEQSAAALADLVHKLKNRRGLWTENP